MIDGLWERMAAAAVGWARALYAGGPPAAAERPGRTRLGCERLDDRINPSFILFNAGNGANGYFGYDETNGPANGTVTATSITLTFQTDSYSQANGTLTATFSSGVFQGFHFASSGPVGNIQSLTVDGTTTLQTVHYQQVPTGQPGVPPPPVQTLTNSASYQEPTADHDQGPTFVFTLPDGSTAYGGYSLPVSLIDPTKALSSAYDFGVQLTVDGTTLTNSNLPNESLVNFSYGQFVGLTADFQNLPAGLPYSEINVTNGTVAITPRAEAPAVHMNGPVDPRPDADPAPVKESVKYAGNTVEIDFSTLTTNKTYTLAIGLVPLANVNATNPLQSKVTAQVRVTVNAGDSADVIAGKLANAYTTLQPGLYFERVGTTDTFILGGSKTDNTTPQGLLGQLIILQGKTNGAGKIVPDNTLNKPVYLKSVAKTSISVYVNSSPLPLGNPTPP